MHPKKTQAHYKHPHEPKKTTQSNTLQTTHIINLAANLKDSYLLLPCHSSVNDGKQFIQLAPNFYLLVQTDPKMIAHNIHTLCCLTSAANVKSD